MGVGNEPCDLCGKAGKYTCPRCSTRSCSLPCVKQHKSLAGCDGIRQKLKYIPLDKFTELDMVQDFRILEEVTSRVDKCRRDKLKRSTRQSVDGYCAPKIASSLRRLQTEAARFGTKVKILPPHFVRRKNNSSHFDFKTKSIHWDVEINLPDINKSIQLKRIPDKTKLWRIFSDIFESCPLGSSVSFPLQELLPDELDVYRGVGYGGTRVYLRCESLPNEGNKTSETKKFHQLDMKRSLRSCLRDKVLVEQPMLLLVMKGEECNYREDVDLSSDLNIEEDMEADDMGSESFHNNSFQGHDRLDGRQIDEVSEEKQSADPVAYKHYFDFYLKYYTQKYSKQGVPCQNHATSHRTTFQKTSVPQPEQTHIYPNQPSQPRVKTSAPVSQPVNAIKKPSDLSAINNANKEFARRIQSDIREDNQSLGLSSLAAYSDSDSE